MKKLGFYALGIGFVLALVGIMSMAVPAQAQTFKLRYTSAYPPPPYPDSAMEQKWMDMVTQRSNGRITWEAFFGGALGGPNETFRLVSSGAADAGAVAYGVHSAEFPLYSWEFCFPFGPPDPKAAIRATNELWNAFPHFEEMVKKQNLHHLFIVPWDCYNMASVKRISTVADLKGKRAGVWGVYFPKWFEAVGASGVATASTERYMMLQTSLLDISVLPVQPTVKLKLQEVTKYWVNANFGPSLAHANSINLNTWKKLPLDLQKIMTDASREIEEIAAQSLLDAREQDMQTLKRAGLEIITMSNEEIKKWSDRIPDMGTDWAKEMVAKGYPGWEMAEKWIQACEKQGHKWSRRWAVKK
jgi:TRAP-type transport system periplasmic protein